VLQAAESTWRIFIFVFMTICKEAHSIKRQAYFLFWEYILRCVLSPSSIFVLASVCFRYDSEVVFLVSCLFRRFLADFFLFGVGITILRTFVSSAVCFAWELVDVPALFKTAVDYTTGGPVGLLFSDGIL
jgi:hypothetical protein